MSHSTLAGKISKKIDGVMVRKDHSAEVFGFNFYWLKETIQIYFEIKDT